jgi:integrase
MGSRAVSELRVRRRYWLECIRLRVKDVDFVYNQIVVRDGKGHKDRGTMLPQHVKAPLQRHLHDVTSCMRSAMAALIEIRRSLEGKLSK